MNFIYNSNGLPFLSESDLILKDYFVRSIAHDVKQIMKEQNRAWDFVQLESPCLIPRELINQNYTNDDVWVQSGDSNLVLKPETTPATYAAMVEQVQARNVVPPICFWQVSKSFRREQDQPTKHCRFKEFYQMEFQCLYTADTKNNYQENVVEKLATMIMKLLSLPTRLVLSDRLPSYSMKTIDIEVNNSDKWMEVASISVRTDFPVIPVVRGKSSECLVLEIAIGVDRLIYNYHQRQRVIPIMIVENCVQP